MLANRVTGGPKVNCAAPAIATLPRLLAIQTATNTFLNTVLSAPDAPTFNFQVPFPPSRNDGLGSMFSQNPNPTPNDNAMPHDDLQFQFFLAYCVL